MTKTLKGSWSEFKDLVREDKRKMDEKTQMQKEKAKLKQDEKEVVRIAKVEEQLKQIRQPSKAPTEQEKFFKTGNFITKGIALWFSIPIITVILILVLFFFVWVWDSITSLF